MTMEHQLIEELLKVTDIAIVQKGLTFIGAWYLLRTQLTKPLNAKIERIENVLKHLSDSLKLLETDHAQQISLMKQDIGYTKIEVSEIKKKIETRNYSGD